MERYQLVTALITTHNRLNLLKRAVESVLNQTYPNIELVIVDDASTDSTQEWCKSLIEYSSNALPPIRYIRIQPADSKGGNYARNVGIKAARGKYVAFLDDDDEWLPDKVSLQVVVHQQYNCGVVYGGRIVEKIATDGTATFLPCSITRLIPYQGDVSKKILTDIFTTTSILSVSRDLLFDVGLFDENLKFWQEYELSIRLAQKTPFYFVDKPVIHYRVDEKDPARLTNKYFAWKQAVKYVHQKHESLYQSLTTIDKIKSHVLVWEDASNRARTCGLTVQYIWYRGLYRSWRLGHSIRNGAVQPRMRRLLYKIGLNK